MPPSSQSHRIGPIVLVASLIAVVMAAGVWRLADSDEGPAGQADVVDVAPPQAEDQGPVSAAQLTGPELEGIFVSLEEPADEDWTVWLETSGHYPAEHVSVGVIPAGQTTLADPDLGLGTIIDRYDQVLVGQKLQEYELSSAELSEQRSAEIRRLILGDHGLPGRQSLLTNATDQVGTFGDHADLLAESLEKGDVAGVRLRAEQLVNIARGQPASDLDGDGLAESPGQAIGLLGTSDRQGYLPQIEAGTNGLSIPALDTLQEVTRDAVRAARDCADTQSVADASECAGEIEQSAEQMDDLWPAVPDAARRGVVLPLQRR